MNGLIERLRLDAGRRTLGELIQDREAAASEIERLMREIAVLRSRHVAADRTAEEARRQAAHEPDTRALLRLVDVCKLVGLSRSSVYARMKEGSFPRAVRLSEHTVRWRASDVATWIADQRPTEPGDHASPRGRRRKS
jgi:prophage regulatory protein